MNEKFLKNIMDVPGVDGVVILDKEDKVLTMELPSYLEDLSFDNLGRRSRLMFDAMEENFNEFQDIVIKFASKLLYIRDFEDVQLVIVAELDVKQTSLKMVTNLARKSLNKDWIASVRSSASRAAPTKVTPLLEAPHERSPLAKDAIPPAVQNGSNAPLTYVPRSNPTQVSIAKIEKAAQAEEPFAKQIENNKGDDLWEPTTKEKPKRPVSKRPTRTFRGASY